MDSIENEGVRFGTGASLGTVTEKMRITQDGLVGIGTIAPSATLHVSSTNVVASSGSSRTAVLLSVSGTMSDLYGPVNGGTAGLVIRNTSLAANSVAGITFGDTDAGGGGRHSSVILSGKENSGWGAASGDYPAYMGFYTRDAVARGGNNTEKVRIASTGNVGISTSSPIAKLDVNGTISASDAIQVGTSSLTCTASVPGAIRYNSGNIQFCNGTSWATVGTSTAPGGSGDIVFNNGSGFAADTGQLYWDATNNRLGVGTASPDTTLHVNAGSAASLTPKTGFFQIGDDASGANVNTAFDWQTIQTRTGGGAAANLFINPHGGNVGIGTTSPQATLQVSGSFTVSTSAQAYTSPSLYVDTMGRATIGTNVPSALFTVVSYTAGLASSQGMYMYLSQNPTSTPNAHYRGMYVINDYNSTQNATAGNSIRGGEFLARSLGTGGISYTYGLLAYGQAAGGNAMYANTALYGVATVSNSITSSFMYGANISTNDYNGPGVGGVGTAYGALISGYSNAGRMTNYYGLFLNSFGGIDPTGDFFGVYQADAAMDNYFAGNVGIGLAGPNSKLEVNGTIATQGNAVSLRQIYGNYGFMHYQDGSNYYMLMTNSGDQYGSYNSLRPFYVNLSSGNVTMSHDVAIGGNITVTGWPDFNYGEIEIQGTQGLKAPFVRFHRPGEEYGQIRYGTDTTHDGYFHFRNINTATYADIAADTVSATTIIAAPPMMIVVDEKASGTAAGTCTSGSWAARVLNTIKLNTITGASLSSNQVTLPAGTYIVRGSTPSHRAGRFKSRFYNVTDAATAIAGQSVHSSSGAGYEAGVSNLVGVVTITASKVFSLDMRCETTNATNGMGLASSLDTEVYATLEITKIQ